MTTAAWHLVCRDPSILARLHVRLPISGYELPPHAVMPRTSDNSKHAFVASGEWRVGGEYFFKIDTYRNGSLSHL